MISQLYKNRVKILSSKGNDNKEISKKTGLAEITIKKILYPNKLPQLFNSKKPIKTVIKTKVSKRPKSRIEMVKEYIKNTDIIWKDDMYAMGVARIDVCLARHAYFSNLKFIKIDEKSWEIKRG